MSVPATLPIATIQKTEIKAMRGHAGNCLPFASRWRGKITIKAEHNIAAPAVLLPATSSTTPSMRQIAASTDFAMALVLVADGADSCMLGSGNRFVELGRFTN